MSGQVIDLGRDFGKKERTLTTIILGIVLVGFYSHLFFLPFFCACSKL